MTRPVEHHARRAPRLVAAAALTAGVAVPVAVAATPASAAGAAPCALPADTVAPQLHDLVLSPSTVDVSHTSKSIGVSVEATDTSASGIPSGVADILVVITGPDGGQNFGAATELRMVSGDATDGVWKGALRLPRFAPAGSYHVADAAVFDVVGNLQSYSDGSFDFSLGGGGGSVTVSGGAGPLLARVRMREQLTGTAATRPATAGGSRPAGSPTDPMLQPGWQPQVNVTSATPPPATGRGSGKVHRGKLTGFTARPQTVDTRHTARRIRVRAHFAGGHPRFAEAFFDDAHAGPDPQFGISMHRHGASYVGSLRVPTWAGSESFHITLYAFYVARSGRQQVQAWTPDQLAAAGYAHVVHVVSRVDHTRPTISSLSIQPDPIDSRNGRVSGQVTVGATDSPSGVAGVYLSFYQVVRQDGFGFTNDVKDLRLQKVHGRWVSPFSVGRCAMGGTWQVDVAAVDRAGNYRELQAPQLAKLGLPSSVKVRTGAGDRTPPAVSDVTTRGQVVTVEFTEPVRNLTTDNLSLYAMQPRADRYRAATAVDAIACYDAAGNAEPDCSGSPTPVSSADLTVNGLASRTGYQLWANQFSVVPQLTDVTGNPMDWLSAAHGFRTY